MRTLLILAIWFTYPAPTPDGWVQPVTSEDAPCFAEVTLVSGNRLIGGWLSLKRTNLDSCAFEPATTTIRISGNIEPRIRKTDKGWEIDFPDRL
jgi:hypothetical protein